MRAAWPASSAFAIGLHRHGMLLILDHWRHERAFANPHPRTAQAVALRCSWSWSVMFGFGYALVPLYDVFCEITGLERQDRRGPGGDRRRGSRTPTARSRSSSSPTSTARCRGSSTRRKAMMSVHPGQLYESTFARKQVQREIVGQAVPSVAPASGRKYFNKTECFCFTSSALRQPARRWRCRCASSSTPTCRKDVDDGDAVLHLLRRHRPVTGRLSRRRTRSKSFRAEKRHGHRATPTGSLLRPAWQQVADRRFDRLLTLLFGGFACWLNGIGSRPGRSC